MAAEYFDEESLKSSCIAMTPQRRRLRTRVNLHPNARHACTATFNISENKHTFKRGMDAAASRRMAAMRQIYEMSDEQRWDALPDAAQKNVQYTVANTAVNNDEAQALRKRLVRRFLFSILNLSPFTS